MPLTGALTSTLLKGVNIMDISAIGSLISTVGFPIACVIAMFMMWDKEREAHKQEMDKVTEAINNNTVALVKLEDALKNGKS